MKQYMATALLLGSLAGNTLRAQAPQWQRVPVDSLTSIELPAAPSKQQVQGQQVLVLNHDGTLYMVLALPNAYPGTPTPDELARFYKGVEEGVLQQAGGGQLVTQSSFTVGGFRGIEARFTTPAKPQLPAVKYMRNVLINHTVYTLNCWTSAENEAANTANRQRFFGSLQTSAQPAQADRRSGVAYRSGYLIGRLFVLGLMLGGLVLLVRRLTRRPSRPV